MMLTFQASWVMPSAHVVSQEGILEKSYHDNFLSPWKGYYFGGENVGWYFHDQRHTNGNTVQFYFDTTVSSSYKTKTREAIAMWSEVVNFSEVTTNYSNLNCLVHQYYDPDRVEITTVESSQVDSSGHYTKWILKINTYYSPTNAEIAHEFGHIIGLLDLVNSKNKNKLMYYERDRTAKAPASIEIAGGRVCVGMHSTHTWKYKYYGSVAGNQHREVCTYCGGVHYGTTQPCRYNAQGRCVVCGSINAV